jgi:hypothetical protein
VRPAWIADGLDTPPNEAAKLPADDRYVDNVSGRRAYECLALFDVLRVLATVAPK